MTFDYATNATFECDKYTEHYGFQEDIKCDSDRDLMNEPRRNDHIWPQSGHASFRAESTRTHT